MAHATAVSTPLNARTVADRRRRGVLSTQRCMTLAPDISYNQGFLPILICIKVFAAPHH
ncbi:hypothetical protein [Pseudoduganella buxea]|uniref:Uncharacterized protein n=1 Tax=Pseudoduganella buxea TaxID=1949069 RepID=A0A6I3SV80_9BURK|nr:hypothetical protein [Pseudoduganella buxea]MTV53053.1 hypothetical protein [Pseudoduganella buxea]